MKYKIGSPERIKQARVEELEAGNARLTKAYAEALAENERLTKLAEHRFQRIMDLDVVLGPFARAYLEAIRNKEIWQGAFDRLSNRHFTDALNQFGGYAGMLAIVEDSDEEDDQG